MKFKKIIVRLISIIICLIIIYIGVLKSAALFFTYHYTHSNYKIFSDTELDSTEILVKSLNERIKSCEIYNNNLKHTIYICSSESKFRFFAKMTGSSYPSQGFNVNYLNKIFISKSFIKQVHTDRKKANKLIPYSVLEGNMTEIICHEIIHSLAYEYLGAKKYALVPFWKQEGYAEYAANIWSKQQDSTYDFNDRIDIYLDDNFWGENNGVKDYYEAEILVENLMLNSIGFDSLMSNHTSFEHALMQLKFYSE
jgi:hypothetical protein